MRYPGFMFNVHYIKWELNVDSAHISFSRSDLMTEQPFAMVWSCLLHKIRNGRLWLATTGSDNSVYRNLEKKKHQTCHISLWDFKPTSRWWSIDISTFMYASSDKARSFFLYLHTHAPLQSMPIHCLLWILYSNSSYNTCTAKHFVTEVWNR
jgi:hypothetical protein